METQQTPKERLLIFINSLNIGQTQFEKNVGIGRGAIAHAGDFLTGKMLKKICLRYQKLNPNWILLNKGEMLLTTEDEKEEEGTFSDYVVEVALLREEIHKMNHNIDILIKEIRDSKK